jgi:Xaa-Pro aminopeptidase
MKADEFRNALAAGHSGTGVIAFPRSEYDRRVEAVRAEMERAGLDLLLVTDTANLFYLTGYYTFGSGNHACLLLGRDGEPVLHVADLEIPSAVVNSWVTDIRSTVWQQQYRTGVGPDLVATVSDFGFASGRIGAELSRRGMLAGTYRALLDGLPDAKFADASMLVDRLTYVKSPLEIDCLRISGSYTVAGIEASYRAARAGVTDNDISRAGYDAMVAAGSEFVSVQPIVTSGVRTSYPHQTCRRIEIGVNDVIFLEYGGCHHRYTAPLMRTIVTGKPTDHMLRIADAAEATLSATLQALEPGRHFRDVVAEAKAVFAPVADEIYFFGSFAYGLGCGFPPTWGGSLQVAEAVDLTLVPGMAFHVPMLFAVPGQFGIAFSESVVITDGGCEKLALHPRELHYA